MSVRTQRVLAWAGLVIAVAGAWYLITQNRKAIDQIKTERDARLAGLAKLISINCHANNDQDRTLATLLAVSLAQPNPSPTLSQLQVRRVFEHELAKLREPARCRAQVLIFLNPKGVRHGGGGGPSGQPGPPPGGSSGGGKPMLDVPLPLPVKVCDPRLPVGVNCP